MSQTRKIASCLTAVLLMCCIIQGEMLWLEDLLREQALPEQNDRYGFDVYLDTMELVWGELVWFPVRSRPLKIRGWQNVRTAESETMKGRTSWRPWTRPVIIRWSA